VSPSESVAVVTGAGRGIGRATALRLAARGCDVALLARTAEQLESVAAEVVALGRRAVALRCDVANAGEIARASERILAELGVPRVVVANAGVVRRALVVDTSEEDWDHVLGVNLKGPFLLARALLPSMVRARRGRFVAVASISATLGTARLSAYCAAKWGLVGFVKSLAEELRGQGLQAMSVLPGSVDTEMLKGGEFEPVMGPEDVAGLVTYAALDAPDAMNGSAIEMFGP
jgi:NAD(P)-dependent dehydrogenase (short-subunit alcohol dehydrogenase family)